MILIFLLAASAVAQVPMATHVEILEAEDARRYDTVLEKLIDSPDLLVRHRAALAAGRIGDERALPALIELLENEAAINTAAMAAFAIGEIESLSGADAILKTLADSTTPKEVTARALEAAGKIAAANAKDEKAKQLGAAVVRVLETEFAKRSEPNVQVIRLGLTAVLRAQPEGADETVRKFLSYTDSNIVADALNTLARRRAKNANREARDLLATHSHAIVRANAARVLGAAEDKEAVGVLLKAATTDSDARVRVSAVRALGALKDVNSVDKLIERGQALLRDHKRSKAANQPETNELREISSALGRILAGSRNSQAATFLDAYIDQDKWTSAEPVIARMQIAPIDISDRLKPEMDWRKNSVIVQGMAELASVQPVNDSERASKEAARIKLGLVLAGLIKLGSTKPSPSTRLLPDLLRAYARLSPEDNEVLRLSLSSPETARDTFLRAAAAELIAERPFSQENYDALNTAFDHAWNHDIQYNDAILTTLGALFKLDKRKSVAAVALASASPDHLVRKKALDLLKDDVFKDNKEIAALLKYAADRHLDQVKRYPGKGTKMGQLLATDADYRRALSRKNGSVKAVLTTEKGTFTIDLLPEDAPLTVDNFIKLARSRYFNGLEVHRVVPNFVMQDGDPRGDGNGGPGWSIRCEINMVPYERGSVGMALSGKDTGGSQWFVTHSPQPHLDGGYTVFGKVNDAGMRVVDNIVRGDKILTVRIVGR
jgi:cyclophilin family peptidyl-prolyl cis-trans isomerase/HEAT repeat protein